MAWQALDKRWIVVALACVSALAIAAGVGGYGAEKGAVLGLVILMVALWGTGVAPNYFGSMVLFAVALIAGLAPANIVFSGFSSAAIWLIVSGFVIGTAIAHSGLGAALASMMNRAFGQSYAMIVIGLSLTAMIFGFLMPSSVGRAVVLVPIGMAMAEMGGLQKGSNGRIGIAVALAIACNMPSFAILPSNIPNVILAGAAETTFGVRLGYLEYLALHYPVLGVIRMVVILGLILWLFPDRLKDETAHSSQGAQVKLHHPRRVGIILAITLAFWVTDSLHGLNPAWVGLAAATVLLAPGFGVVTPAAFKASADFGLLIFVVGAMALGQLVDISGLVTDIGQFLAAVLPLGPDRDFANFMSLSLMATVTGIFTTTPATPSILTPMAAELAQLTGLPLKSVLMTQVVGFSTVLLPFQVAPLVVAMQMSGEKMAGLIKVMLISAAISFVVIIPLDYLWWQALGLF